ncbi:MAG: glutamate ligase domain-containing protein, partial [Solirubrobacterales bacterium]
LGGSVQLTIVSTVKLFGVVVSKRTDRVWLDASGAPGRPPSYETNVASAIAAILSFDGGVHAILGGSLKGESFEGLGDPVAERCVACYLIGEAAPRLAEDLGAAAKRGVALVECGTLERAVDDAAARAKPGETVLLAPACASFDAFRDYEQRGERVRELVEALG